MSQLTSIAALRNSTAMQSRVTAVENFLKSLNPAWQASWWFPIGIIRVSNDSADCTWVRDHTGTHHKGAGNLTISGVTVPAASVIEALKGVQANDMERLKNFDDALANLVGPTVKWIDGMIESEVAAAQVPFSGATAEKAGESTAASSAGAAADSAKKGARKSTAAQQKPISTKPSKPTKLDEAKALFANLTPKQKVELVTWAEAKVQQSKPCLAEREKLNSTSIAG